MRKVVFTVDGATLTAHVCISLERTMNDVLALYPNAQNVHVMDAARIPADRTFRDALQFDGVNFSYSMEKCRAVLRSRVRFDRRPLMRALDGEWMRCMGQGDAVGAAAVEVKRQRLRDAPAHPDIDAASTPEELKALDLLKT